MGNSSANVVAARVRVGRTATVTLTVALTVWFIDNLDRGLVAFAMPLIAKEFEASNSQLGWLVGGYTAAMALMKIPAGVMADRFGPRKLLMVELVAWTVFMLLMGLSTTFFLLLTLRVTFGLFAGMLAVSVIKMVAERIVPRWRTAGVGVVATGNLVLIATIPLLVAPLVATFDWRLLFMVTGLFGLVAALIVRAAPPPLPPELRTEPATDIGARTIPVRAILAIPAMWRLALLSALLNMVSFGLFNWGPTYLIQQRGVDPAATGWMTSIPFAVMGLSVALGSLLYDRVFHRRPRLLATPALLASSLLMIPMAMSGSAIQFVVFQAAAMALAGLAEVTITGTVMRGVPTEAMGTVMGVVATGMFTGGFLAPLMIGYVSDYFSFGAAFGVLVCTTALAAVIFLFVRPDFFTPQTGADQR